MTHSIQHAISPNSTTFYQKFRFPGISRYQFKVNFWFNLNLYRGISVFRCWGCSCFLGTWSDVTNDRCATNIVSCTADWSWSDIQSQSPVDTSLVFFDGTWQKRPRELERPLRFVLQCVAVCCSHEHQKRPEELEHQLRCENGEMTLWSCIWSVVK